MQRNIAHTDALPVPWCVPESAHKVRCRVSRLYTPRAARRAHNMPLPRRFRVGALEAVGALVLGTLSGAYIFQPLAARLAAEPRAPPQPQQPPPPPTR